MADLKISALPASTTPLAGTEVLPIVQNSTTKQVTVANLTAGRAVNGLSFSAATFGAPASTTLSIQANATTYATVLGAGTNNGFVGLGTTSPQARLQVLDLLKISNAAQSQGALALGDGSSTQFGVGLARWNGATNAAGAGGMGYFAQGAGNAGGHYFYTGDAVAGSTTLRATIDASGNLGLGTSSPSASAILDAQSTTKGVRMPNMTTTQKNAIASPAAGLMVFDTTLAKLCVYSGAAWQTITSV
jgi:hypothetical protein